MEDIIDHDLEENIENKLINIYFLYLQDPEDLKEVATNIERLLKRSLTMILKRVFEIRKES